MDLIPFSFGAAFELWSKDQASGSFTRDPSYSSVSRSLRLYGNLQEAEVPDPKGGTKMVPVLQLFMVLEECNGAVDQAIEADWGKSDDFEIVHFLP